MAISLDKGGRINLSKDEFGNRLTVVKFGVNWGAIERGGWFSKSTEAVDLDATAILLDSNNRKVDEVSFRHLRSNDGSIRHSGDDLVGDVGGDDGKDNETISVELTKTSTNVDKVVFILNSYRHQKFNKIPYMGIRIYTGTLSSPKVLAKFDLKQDSNDPDTTFKDREAIILGYAYRRADEWKFKALGNTGNWRSIDEIVGAIPNYL